MFVYIALITVILIHHSCVSSTWIKIYNVRIFKNCHLKSYSLHTLIWGNCSPEFWFFFLFLTFPCLKNCWLNVILSFIKMKSCCVYCSVIFSSSTLQYYMRIMNSTHSWLTEQACWHWWPNLALGLHIRWMIPDLLKETVSAWLGGHSLQQNLASAST